VGRHSPTHRINNALEDARKKDAIACGNLDEGYTITAEAYGKKGSPERKRMEGGKGQGSSNHPPGEIELRGPE